MFVWLRRRMFRTVRRQGGEEEPGLKMDLDVSKVEGVDTPSRRRCGKVVSLMVASGFPFKTEVMLEGAVRNSVCEAIMMERHCPA